MLVAALLTSSVLSLGKSVEGDACHYATASLRVYKVQNSTILSDCPPPGRIDENTNPQSQQNAFLIQYLPKTLTSEGFRTTLRPLNGEIANFARIAATEPQDPATGPSNLGDIRHYTKLRDDASEVVLSIAGNRASGQTLVVSHQYMDGSGQTHTDTVGENLLPSDFLFSDLLELDTRVNNDNSGPNVVRDSIRIQVCVRRGVGSCHTFTIPQKFGQLAAPEFYLGTFMSTAQFPNLRARYCYLPPFDSTIGSGYSSVCPGPDAP